MTATSRPLLSLRDVEVRYGPALALDGVSVDVHVGEATALLGPNGAGKSSLARAVSGLVAATRGSIEFDGDDITSQPAHRIRRSGLVYLPEGRGIFPGLTVHENLRMAASVLPRAERRDATAHALELFPSLDRRRSTLSGMLSGGEQQMLSLCRALLFSPKMIIADEMSLGLAPKMVDMVFESLATLRARGVTVVIIEQYVHRALEFADQAVLLLRGQVAWQGDAKSAKKDILERYLGESAAIA